MKIHQLAAIRTIAITSLLLILASGYSGFAQTPAAPPTLAPPLIEPPSLPKTLYDEVAA